jgi:hypothetical protein
MPLKKGKSNISKNIKEFHAGKTYAHTAAKFGKKDADRQAIAVALSTARKARSRGGSVEGDGKDDVSYGGQLPRSLQPMTTHIPDSWIRTPPRYADGGDVSDADQAAMSPETYVNPLASKLIGGTAAAMYSIPKNFVEGSRESMSGNGVGELSPKSAQASGDLVMQGIGNAAGVRPGAGNVAGVFVGPYGAHMLRDADRAALKPHPVIGEELAQKAANLRPEFRDVYKGAVQDMRDAEGRGILEMRQGSGNTADQDVWDRSGWFRGAEGMPKKEIPDVNSRLIPVEGKSNEFRIDHPAGDFHKIYDVPNIKFDPNIPRRNGKFNTATNQITLGGNPTKSNIEAARSDTLHELMHAIQKKEGFAKGSSVIDANLNPRSPIAQEIFEIKDGRLVPSWQEYIKNKDPDWRSTYSAYRRSAGETEPFNVQDRLAKSYKYLIKPEYTERTGRGLQWVNPNNMARPREDIKIHDLSAMGPNDAIPPEGAHTVGQISRGNAFRNYARDLVENKASGGTVSGFNPERGAAFGLAHQGAIKSSVPGRTDKLNLNVLAGSSVIPSDVVSGLGQGNTDAGHAILDKMFKSGPYGMNLPRAKAGSRVGTRKSSLSKMNFAEGGEVPTTPIVAAGGEHILSPDQVTTVGGGDIDLGHQILNNFYEQVRAKTIKTMRGLKPPKC